MMENREKPPKNPTYKSIGRNKGEKTQKTQHTKVQGERKKGNKDKPKIKLCITKLDKIKLNLY